MLGLTSLFGFMGDDPDRIETYMQGINRSLKQAREDEDEEGIARLKHEWDNGIKHVRETFRSPSWYQHAKLNYLDNMAILGLKMSAYNLAAAMNPMAQQDEIFDRASMILKKLSDQWIESFVTRTDDLCDFKESLSELKTPILDRILGKTPELARIALRSAAEEMVRENEVFLYEWEMWFGHMEDISGMGGTSLADFAADTIEEAEDKDDSPTASYECDSCGHKGEYTKAAWLNGFTNCLECFSTDVTSE